MVSSLSLHVKMSARRVYRLMVSCGSPRWAVRIYGSLSIGVVLRSLVSLAKRPALRKGQKVPEIKYQSLMHLKSVKKSLKMLIKRMKKLRLVPKQ